MTDISPENVARMLELLHFHDMRVNFGEVADTLEALSARLAEVEAERDGWLSNAMVARENWSEQETLREMAEAEVARLRAIKAKG